MTPSYEDVDFLTEATLVDDPYPYYDFLRECPVRTVPPHGIVAVTGWDEAVSVWRDVDTYSSCNAFGGPFPGPPVDIEGHDDIRHLIERFRDVYPISEHFVTFDPPMHTMHRGLMMRLMTPKRMEENEAFMWGLADELIDGFAADGRCEFIRAYADRFALLTVADLLGVPEEDHRDFVAGLEAHVAGALGQAAQQNPFGFLEDTFTGYVEDRRRSPRGDVMTKLAQATYPDGTTPEVIDVVRIAVFLFAAGRGTTANLLGSLMLRLGERRDLQERVRADRTALPRFVEETLRLESPTKTVFRLVAHTTDLAGASIPAGTTVMLMPGAANRDPRNFEDPAAFRLDRSNVREHLAFGRGIHSCPGAALARAETRISLSRLLDRLGDIRISDAHHGPEGDRHYSWDPSFMLRGLQALHLEFTPLG
ncbi:MAG: cytochrome P450 [Acidimicrobiia bacterium]